MNALSITILYCFADSVGGGGGGICHSVGNVFIVKNHVHNALDIMCMIIYSTDLMQLNTPSLASLQLLASPIHMAALDLRVPREW